MPMTPQNKQEDLVDLSRKPIVNQLLAVKESLVKRPPDNNMHGLVEENKLAWFLKNLGHLGNTHYPYQVYAKPAVNNGIFRMEPATTGPTTIALLGDWASSTAESIQIAQLTGVQDYSIHLGDTYYVGNSKEIADNFNDTFDAPWPYGRHGSFAMLGNHEMYSSGKSYFTELLPYMGCFSPGKDPQRQEASYFCLENDHWRIISLDTGYNSLKGWLGLNANTGLRLRDELVAWLSDTVKPTKDNRGIILLSHHQCFSAFEKDEFKAFIPQLLPLLGQRNVLWFWGHEHRLSFYGYNPLGSNTGCFARCIGHGGMPVELSSFTVKSSQPSDKANANLVFYDERKRIQMDGNIALGHNGYVILEINGQDLAVKYYDDSFVDASGVRSPIVEEQWSIDTATGALTGKNIIDYTDQQPVGNPRLTRFQSNIRLAISA
jgi:hypothetical protein